jgi:hypothetical protein
MQANCSRIVTKEKSNIFSANGTVLNWLINFKHLEAVVTKLLLCNMHGIVRERCIWHSPSLWGSFRNLVWNRLIYFILINSFLWGRISLCSPGWPQMHNAPDSASLVLGFQVCTTKHGF